MENIKLHRICVFCADEGKIKISEGKLNRNKFGICEIDLKVRIKIGEEFIECYQCKNHIIELSKSFKLTQVWKNKMRSLFGNGNYKIMSGVFKLKFKPRNYEDRWALKSFRNMNILALEGLPNGIECTI